jgi:hypothetical protein
LTWALQLCAATAVRAVLADVQEDKHWFRV